MAIDLEPLIEALEKVKLQCTKALNGGAQPICGNCKSWEEPLSPSGHSRTHGVCSGIMANAQTYNRLLTMSDFGCIYHEPKE